MHQDGIGGHGHPVERCRFLPGPSEIRRCAGRGERQGFCRWQRHGGGAPHFAMGGPHGGGEPHGTPLRLGTPCRHGRRAPRGAPLHGGRQRQIRGSVPSHGARVLEVRIHLPPAESLQTPIPLGRGAEPSGLGEVKFLARCRSISKAPISGLPLDRHLREYRLVPIDIIVNDDIAFGGVPAVYPTSILGKDSTQEIGSTTGGLNSGGGYW